MEGGVRNARVVTRDAVLAGSVAWQDGRITGVDQGSGRTGIDLDGDFLLPGLIELHTDNLEKHYAPRIGVVWDAVSAAVSHDVQCAGSGITTVFDSLVLGAAPGWEIRDQWLRPMLDGLATARAAGMLKGDHRLHLRCEVTHPDIVPFLERFLGEPALGFMSLMDHAPGDRQSPDIEAYRRRYRNTFGLSEQEVEDHVSALLEGSRLHGPGNRLALGALARARNIPLASHDDAREEHVLEALELGAVLTEFPTTLEAARAAHGRGLKVLMGAPNLIRGHSHSGNVAAADLAREGVLDILSSDYIPASLLQAAFRLADDPFGIPLPDAVATATANPAEAAGLDDRGMIAEGRRADLVRVRVIEGRPVVRAVWVEGERVA
jgi:alpha-D-ribose 1-methylphosphonate 5-triphosphate diphosphatase